MGIAERYEETSREVAAICQAAGRDPLAVRLVAVSKTVGAEGIAQAIEGGATDLGENRPDRLMEMHDRFPQVRWHFIGNIQSRRIRDIVGRAALIHSLHEERHARKIDEAAREQGIVQDVLLEVNVSGEESKSGTAPDEALALLRCCEELRNLRAVGLMTMAPQGDPQAAREAFAGLRELLESLQGELPPERREGFSQLSMGMSEDWPLAIEEGATLVRIGRRIFSDAF